MLSLNREIIANVSDSDTLKVNALLKKAQNSFDNNKLSEAITFSRSALRISAENKDNKRIAQSLLLLGQIQSISGKKDSSILTFKKSLGLFNALNNEYEVGGLLYRIGNVFKDIGNLDSAEFYCNEALDLRKKISDKRGEASTLNGLGVIFASRGKYSLALNNYFHSLEISEEIDDKALQASAYNNIGIVFWNQGDYTKALEYFFKSVNIREALKDEKGKAVIFNNIGLVYQQSGDLKLALKYHFESLKISQQYDNKLSISYSYLNLGDIYQLEGDFKKALDYYQKSEVIKKELSNLNGLADLYFNMGKLYRELKSYKESLDYLSESEKIYQKIGDPFGMANCLIHKGLSQFEKGLKNEAINDCIQGIMLAKRIGALVIVKQGYENLSKIYERDGNINKAFDSYKKYDYYSDSLKKIESAKEIVKVQTQVELDKLIENKKLEQENKLFVAQGKTQKLTKLANIFIFAFVITLSIFIIFFINSRQKQKSNDILAFQKLDMERQKSELMSQRDELEIQKNLVVHQRDKIMTMLTELGESIDYARKIQQALLPSDKKLEDLLGSHFKIFQPRESVGGDFYWVAQHEGLTLLAVGDCTGHGVPGGFMSMLGVSLLNEMITRSECTSPSKMLWNLREMIIKALSQTGLDDDSQDGMDLALCIYNPQTRVLLYSGANSSVIIVTANQIEPNEKVFVNGNMVELKPDRMPIAYYPRMGEYFEHRISLNKGDLIYLFSDGFVDQFGGPNNKKFGYATFKDLISRTSTFPFEKQRDYIWNAFDKWKGEENQTDDVLVMGIKVS